MQKPFKDLIQGVGIEEISHVKLVTTRINLRFDCSARYRGKEGNEAVPPQRGLACRLLPQIAPRYVQPSMTRYTKVLHCGRRLVFTSMAARLPILGKSMARRAAGLFTTAFSLSLASS